MGFFKCIQKEKATLFLTEWLVKSSLNLVFAKESTPVILELSVAIFCYQFEIYCSREALNCDWLVPQFEIQKKRDLNFNRR